MITKMAMGGGVSSTLKPYTWSGSASSGYCTVPNVQGTMVVAVAVFTVNSSLRTDVCDNTSDTIRESESGGAFNSETQTKITQNGTTATVKLSTSQSPSVQMVYYCLE